MDVKIIGGVLLVCAIIVVAGVFFYNSDSDDITGVNDNPINTTNNDTANTSQSSDQLALTLLPDNQPGPKPGPSPSPSPGPTPDPTPDPTPGPMDHVISLFDAYVKSIFSQTGIPGAAVVIVQDNKIIYLNCLGVKDLASGQPVDPNTLFMIGSNTKAFTATHIAQLVSKGLMSWDDPIAKYYPDPSEFQLYSNYVTNHITIRDALSHRSGLAAYAGDEFGSFNTAFPDILYQFRYITNNTQFRSTWQYNNIIYALPGFCAARATNTTWGDLIKQDLLIPLGMTTATTTLKDFENSPNHAKPYKYLVNGTLIQYDLAPDPVGPAGIIGLSISEMANWLLFQIADTGYYDGKKIVSKKELDETRTGQIKINDVAQYGLGWGVSKEFIMHTGATDAFRSFVKIYPSKGLGIAIFTNTAPYGDGFYTSLDKKFYDLLNNIYTTDPWPAEKRKIEETLKPVLPNPPKNPVKPLPLGNYTGVYHNNFYGNVKITTSNNTLTCYYGNNSYPYKLKHWSGNVFEEVTNNFAFNFTDISKGKANKLTVSFIDYSTTPPANTTTFNRTK